MRRLLKIFAIILVWLLASAKGCDERDEPNAAQELVREQATRDSLAAVFSKDTLSVETLRSFELNAVGKLSDLADYMKIFTDTMADPVFRDKSREMIVNLFINGEVRLEPYLYMPENTTFRVKELKTTKLNILWPMVFLYDSVRVVQPMQQASDTLCSGRLGFILTDPAGRFTTIRLTSEFLAVKRKKSFGNDTLRVWEVLLGNIYQKRTLKVKSEK